MTKLAFSGAAGNGISPLEQIMIKKGCEVYGSDRSFDLGGDSKIRCALESVGLKIIPQDGTGITPDFDCLYVSAAVNESNPDIIAARKYNIPVKQRSDLLAELLSGYKYGIAVGGTAGKTTTTAMIGYALDHLGQKPCVVNGSILCNYQDRPGLANYLYNESDICVIEADESDGSIKKYYPYIGIINNISHDHTSIEKLVEYFTTFAAHVQYGLVVNYDCEYTRAIKHHKNTVTFSTCSRNADIFAYNIKPLADGVEYSLDGKTFRLNLLGRFNVENALAAIAACMLLGLDKFDAAKALESFTGTKRRLEKVGTAQGITFYDDFAHNPSKLEASLAALKEHPGRIIAMYQPHTPFSARNVGKEMAAAAAKVLAPDDIIIMQEIYEKTPADSDISSADIINEIKRLGHDKAYFLPAKADTKAFVLAHAKPGDRIVIMGAHDNTLPDFSRELLGAFE